MEGHEAARIHRSWAAQRRCRCGECAGPQMRRIGALMPFSAEDQNARARYAAFLQALGQLGWTIGRNVRIDTRWATTNAADIRRHAAELAALAPDVILAFGTSTVGAVAAGDPHRAGRVPGRRRSGRRWFCSDSLARPGGNVTGFDDLRIQHWRENGWSCSSRSRPGVTPAAILRDTTVKAAEPACLPPSRPRRRRCG